jgi:hypothetical protein
MNRQIQGTSSSMAIRSSSSSFRFSCTLLLFLTACTNPLPTLTGIDLTVWKQDKKGCGGKRFEVIQQLKEQKNKLQGLSEMDLVQLLGRPDSQELYKRNQKFYYYLLEPGKACGSSGDAKRLSIRFNATGAAKEIAIE